MFRKTYEAPREAQVATVPDYVANSAQPNLNGVRVLVTDDERDARLMVAMALQSCGAQVETAHSADEAISHLGRHQFDVVVTDLAMPENDGFALMRALRLRGKRMPVIALSALKGQKIEDEVKSAGFSQHLDKPIEITFLACAVADAAWLYRHPEEKVPAT